MSATFPSRAINVTMPAAAVAIDVALHAGVQFLETRRRDADALRWRTGQLPSGGGPCGRGGRFRGRLLRDPDVAGEVRDEDKGLAQIFIVFITASARHAASCCRSGGAAQQFDSA